MPTEVIKGHATALGSSFVEGLLLALRAIKVALANPTVNLVQKQTLANVVLLSVGVYTYIFVSTLPVHLVLRLLHVVKDTADYRAYIAKWTTASFFYVPVCVAFLVRWIFYKPLERVYFAVLKGLDPDLATELEKIPRRSLREVLWVEARRLVTYMAYFPVLSILSIIPGVSTLLKFLWSCYTFAKWFDPAIATCLAVLSVFPLTSYVVSLGVQVFIGQMYVLLEVSQPYLARKQLHKSEEIAVITKERVKALGFILPFGCLLTIPFLGPFFWVLAHAAAPFALKELSFANSTTTTTASATGAAAVTAKVTESSDKGKQ